MSQEKEKNDNPFSEDTKEQFPTLSSPGSSDEADDDSTGLLGSVIGNYKLLSELGKGGFGIVYLAEQIQPVTRQVALKIIKLGMDTKQVIARFEAERQALAMMDHPNIAHIYDGGTTKAGRPYFVMEYVEGTPITEYCDEQKLCIKERLELFEQVCKAAQHAHQKGIIHRDIKPSNVLLSLQDDKPVPKIIDFGIAKAVGQSLTERTFTEKGQFIGTVEYMSPEQATLTNQDIDTRSDIYSLGVLLYELLTGALPFESSMLHQVAFDERLRIIREEDPPRPSACLSSLGGRAHKVAQCRQTEVAALAKRLHKELEWIPLKAIRKEPERRYKTASELADDVQNYLNGRPLIAGPDSIWYRLRKSLPKQAKYGALIIVSLTLVLLLPWISTIWIRQLTRKILLDTNRARVESVLFHLHFQPEARGELSLPSLNELGAARDANDLDFIWIPLTSEQDTDVSRLNSDQCHMLEELINISSMNEKSNLEVFRWSRRDNGFTYGEYVRLFIATESCLECHNFIGSGRTFTLGTPIGAAFITSTRIAHDFSRIMIINRIWAVGAGSIGLYIAILLIYWTLNVGEKWEKKN